MQILSATVIRSGTYVQRETRFYQIYRVRIYFAYIFLLSAQQPSLYTTSSSREQRELLTRQEGEGVRLSMLNASEAKLRKHDPISRIVRATLTLRYGTFLGAFTSASAALFSLALGAA